MRKLEIKDATIMRIAAKQEILRSEESDKSVCIYFVFLLFINCSFTSFFVLQSLP